jgi:hypothetical protein
LTSWLVANAKISNGPIVESIESKNSTRVGSVAMNMHLHAAINSIGCWCITKVIVSSRGSRNTNSISRAVVEGPEFNIAGISQTIQPLNIGHNIHIVDNLLDDGWSYSIATLKRQAGDANFLRIVGEGVH